jgi:hypothetical protein
MADDPLIETIESAARGHRNIPALMGTWVCSCGWSVPWEDDGGHAVLRRHQVEAVFAAIAATGRLLPRAGITVTIDPPKPLALPLLGGRCRRCGEPTT